MWECVIIVGLVAVYWILQEGVRRLRLDSLWLAFGLAPILLTPYWLHENCFDTFVWLKIYSVLFCICWAGWLRFTASGQNKWCRRSVTWLLAANILEATVVDLAGNAMANWLNGLAGLLLLVSIPYREDLVRIDQSNTLRDLQFDLGLPWIIGYTLWNWTFVYINYPAFSGHHTAILAAALIAGAINPRIWLQARAATLGSNLVLFATSYSGTLELHDASQWQNMFVGNAIAACALLWISGILVISQVRLRSPRPLEISKVSEYWLDRTTMYVTELPFESHQHSGFSTASRIML